MKVVNSSELVDTFLEKNNDLPVVSESEVIIHIIEISDRLRVVLDVDDYVTHEQIRDAIPLALAWRDRVKNSQGPTRFWNNRSFIFSLVEYLDKSRFNRLATYSKLAACVNSILSEWISETSNTQYVSTFIDSYLYQAINFDMFEIKDRIPDPVKRVRTLMGALGFDSKEINEYFETAKQTMTEGKSPYSKDYPITKDKILQLRRWADNEKKGVVKS